MLDIVNIEDGHDLRIADTVAPKAGNVLSVQIGDLEYAPDFGVDLKFFLENPIEFQNESFKAYLVRRLSRHQINVSDVIEQFNALFAKFTFVLQDADISGEGFIR